MELSEQISNGQNDVLSKSGIGNFSHCPTGGLTLSDIPKLIAKTNLLHLFLDIVLVVLGNCFMHTNEDAIS